MKIVASLILTAVVILALFLFLMDVLGISFGVRIGGNLFADEWSGSVKPGYRFLLAVAAAGGLYLLWRGGRRVR